MTHTASSRLKYVGMILDFKFAGEYRETYMPSFVDTVLAELGVISTTASPAVDPVVYLSARKKLERIARYLKGP